MTAQPADIFRREVPRWAVPLIKPKRIKGAKGGRSSGKSHERIEAAIERMRVDPDYQVVCIREIQKSLKYSAKKLFEAKIRKMGLAYLFDITQTEIRRLGGEGLVVFVGMQDHTADSIKSLEAFDLALCEEAQSLSKRSIELLTPTLRKDTSELWFIWNPDQPDDAIELLFKGELGVSDIDGKTLSSDDCEMIHVNYLANPWCPEVMKREAAKLLKRDPEAHAHVWLGGYNTKSKAQIFAGCWRVDEFEPEHSWGAPLYGMDFGFSNDPTCFVRCWIHNNVLYIDQDAGQTGLELDNTAKYFQKADPRVVKNAMRADSARPESISFLRRHGLPRIESVKKWPGSVNEGVEFLKTFDEIVIHVRCKAMQEEARLYSYKIDKRTGDVLPEIVDDFNHRWDAVRYALQPMIKQMSIIFESL